MESFISKNTNRKEFTDHWLSIFKDQDLDKHDLELAISLAWYISNADILIFPDKPSKIIIETSAHPKKSTALYHSPAYRRRRVL